MEMSVAEVARQRDVSPQRVRELARSGAIRSRRLGGHWLIDPADAARASRLSRPMSNRMAWAMCMMLSGRRPAGLDPSEMSRLRKRIALAKSLENPAPQVGSWLSGRAPRLKLSVNPRAIPRLLGDERVLLSGLSDSRAQMSAANVVEGYVSPQNLPQLRRDYLLIEGAENNVYLHIADVAGEFGMKIRSGDKAPLGLVIADLADHQSEREDSQVHRLLASVPS